MHLRCIASAEFNMSVDGIISQINRMNQRGGRMLSMTDLIRAGTLSVDLAAHLVARQIRGVSVASGAGPGGTGKTTLLGALLAFTPPGRKLVTITADQLRKDGKRDKRLPESRSGTIYLCHEVSPGHYFSYIWGSRLGLYFTLVSEPDHYLAFTIHAESPEEICAQVEGSETGLSEDACLKLDLLIFMGVVRSSPSPMRRVTAVFEREVERDGFVQTYLLDRKHDAFRLTNRLTLHDSHFDDERGRIAGILRFLLANDISRIEDVRNHFFYAWGH
jgi:hypothetical protein